MIRVFIGADARQQISLTVATTSFFLASSKPVSVSPISADQCGVKRQGLTPFTWARFLVPYLCDFKGWALFVDADVLCLADPAELFAQADATKAVMAVNTKPEFERAAVMLFNCGHPDNAVLTPEYIETANGLHQLRWTQNIGWLDKRWNHLVGYDEPRPDPAIIHYTMGVPCWGGKTDDCEHAELWWAAHQAMNSAQSWEEIMGNSIHNGRDDRGDLVPLYKAARNMEGERIDAAPAA
jgi:lipopolysaccharide biosynthesis glycosyltransferase